MPTAEMFRPGVYEHHKGGLYRALFLAHDSWNESQKPGQWLVIYVSLGKLQQEHTEFAGQMNARPLAEFWELVMWPNEEMRPRFTWIHP